MIGIRIPILINLSECLGPVYQYLEIPGNKQVTAGNLNSESAFPQ